LEGTARNFRGGWRACLTLAALLVWPAVAAAQCPLCRSALQGEGDQTARTMNLAILVLLIPPVSIFCTIFAVAYRKRRGGGDEEEHDRGLEP
jgi:heme/copper-type cytochrome/quinol oxidase subunit 2